MNSETRIWVNVGNLEVIPGNICRKWRSETENDIKSIKSVLIRKLLFGLLASFLQGHPGRQNCSNWQAKHWGVYLPTLHPSLFEGWIQGFWLILRMSPLCSHRQKKALQQRAAGKQWVAWILNECQRTWAGKWQFLLQVTPANEGSP